jgi:hypothetical protein
MQTRYVVARATVTQYTHSVPIPKNTFSPYGDSDEDSDGSPPSPKKTGATEMKIDESSQIFIEALPYLEPFHYGFKFQASNKKEYCFVLLQNASLLAEKTITLKMIIQCVGKDIFKVVVFFNIVTIRVMNEFYTATAFYLTTLFKNGMRLTHAAVHHGTNDQSRKTADANKQISGCYYQSVDSQGSDHPYQVNENIVDNTCDTVRDLAFCDGVEKNDIFTSIEQDAENQAKDVQAELFF